MPDLSPGSQVGAKPGKLPKHLGASQLAERGGPETNGPRRIRVVRKTSGSNIFVSWENVFTEFFLPRKTQPFRRGFRSMFPGPGGAGAPHPMPDSPSRKLRPFPPVTRPSRFEPLFSRPFLDEPGGPSPARLLQRPTNAPRTAMCPRRCGPGSGRRLRRFRPHSGRTGNEISPA